MRILIRGGSIAAGIGAARSYVDIVRERLAADGREVLNVSRARDTSFQAVWDFAPDIEQFRPDILVLHFGIDDIYRPVYRSEFRENLVQVIRLARVRFNPKIYLMGSHSFPNPVEMDAAWIFYSTMREVAQDLACVFVPVHLAWMNHLYETGRKHEELVQKDERLPNEEGHRLYAKALIKAFARNGVCG
ncbi:MAG: SGNH/GDSL hydrolase family protein [Spirochaetes bacterium]|nr:MAG: SGNH/GDSL hydrolase family protein [Spirochaetota bacterium]